MMAVALQDFYRALYGPITLAPEFARTGIVDENCIFVGCYGEFSGFLVKL